MTAEKQQTSNEKLKAMDAEFSTEVMLCLCVRKLNFKCKRGSAKRNAVDAFAPLWEQAKTPPDEHPSTDHE
jgi:hypothetical protein